MRRFLSIDPTAKYFASGPNFTQLALPEIRAEYVKHKGLTTKSHKLYKYVEKEKKTCARQIRESFDTIPF